MWWRPLRAPQRGQAPRPHQCCPKINAILHIKLRIMDMRLMWWHSRQCNLNSMYGIIEMRLMWWRPLRAPQRGQAPRPHQL
jgi:hypothetical protein